MAIVDRDERRTEPRKRTSFFAVELRGNDLYYRLVRDISPHGFCFDEKFPLERPGDAVVMEFPQRGTQAPLRVCGEVVYVEPTGGVGVRITDVERERYSRLVAVPPPGPLDPS
jgi:hypothetical protein